MYDMMKKQNFGVEIELTGITRDEAAGVIVDEDGNLVLEDVWNGFDDLEEAGWEREGDQP